MKPDEKRCPRCAETIKADALACRHCGYEFSPEEVAASRVKRRKEQRNGAIGCLALVVVTVGMVTCSDKGESPKIAIKPDTSFGQVANVSVRISDVSRSGALYDYAADALARIGANSSEGKKLLPPTTRTLNIEIFGPETSQREQSSYLHATYNVEDLRAAVTNGTQGDELLGLGSDMGTHTPENDDIVREHCAGASTTFCRKAEE